MNSYDKALEHLNQATQHSFEANLEEIRRDQCWRCFGKAGSGPSGVCDRCREVLLADLPPSEPQMRFESPDLDVDALQAGIWVLGEALQAYFDRMWEQFGAGWANLVEIMRERAETGPNPAQIAAIGTRWAETDLYERIWTGEADIHCPRGPITFPHLPEEPS